MSCGCPSRARARAASPPLPRPSRARIAHVPYTPPSPSSLPQPALHPSRNRARNRDASPPAANPISSRNRQRVVSPPIRNPNPSRARGHVASLPAPDRVDALLAPNLNTIAPAPNPVTGRSRGRHVPPFPPNPNPSRSRGHVASLPGPPLSPHLLLASLPILELVRDM